MGLHEHAAYYAGALRLGVDKAQQAQAVYALYEGCAAGADELAHLVGLQVSDEVPANVGRQSRGFVEELLHTAFAESPLAGVVGLGYGLGGMEFRNRHEAHSLRKCRLYGG